MLTSSDKVSVNQKRKNKFKLEAVFFRFEIECKD